MALSALAGAKFINSSLLQEGMEFVFVCSLVIQNQLLTSNPSNDLSIPYGHKGILVWVEDLQFLRKSEIKAFEAVEEAVIVSIITH